MVDRFFRQIIAHQAFIQQQEAEVAYQTNAQEAGYEVVKRGDGKAQLKRAVAKVGRNDPCPCGSGKKYKQCHMRQDQAKASGRVTAVAANGQRQPSKNLKKKKKKSRRR
jgi:hypothetical protein